MDEKVFRLITFSGLGHLLGSTLFCRQQLLDSLGLTCHFRCSMLAVIKHSFDFFLVDWKKYGPSELLFCPDVREVSLLTFIFLSCFLVHRVKCQSIFSGVRCENWWHLRTRFARIWDATLAPSDVAHRMTNHLHANDSCPISHLALTTLRFAVNV